MVAEVPIIRVSDLFESIIKDSSEEVTFEPRLEGQDKINSK